MAARLVARTRLSLSPVSRPTLSPIAVRAFAMSAPRENPWADALPKPVEEMSTYLAIVPDFIEGSKRMSVRPSHLEDAKTGFAKGWIIKAGATFEGEHGEHDPPKMNGSWFLVRGTSKSDVHDRLSRDVYTTGGAWDMSRVSIQAVAIAKH